MDRAEERRSQRRAVLGETRERQRWRQRRPVRGWHHRVELARLHRRCGFDPRQSCGLQHVGCGLHLPAHLVGLGTDAIGVLDFNEMLRWAFDPGSQPPGPGPPVRGSVRVLQSAAYASARSVLGSHRVGNRKRGWRLGERLPSVRERRRRLLGAQGHVECLLAVEPGGQKPFTEVAVARAAERSRVP